jgi:hypothetical protein
MERSMTDYVRAWQCIGCGRIDAPENCIGVCEYRKAEFVYATEYEQALAQSADLQRRAAAFGALVRQLAATTPRKGEWERSYRALQQQARRALAALPSGQAEAGVAATTDAGPAP